MFKIIRCGAGFDLVIVKSPTDAGPDAKDTKYYRYATWSIGDHEARVFNEITSHQAMLYFSGQADGLGWESIPADVFPTLDATLQYIRERRKPIMKKRMEEAIKAAEELGWSKEKIDELKRDYTEEGI